MRLLERLKTGFEYRDYLGKSEKLSNGNHTGVFEPTYSSAVVMRGHIGPAAGEAQAKMFGLETHFTHVLLMDETDAPIKVSGLIDWNGKSYEVLAVRETQNYLAIAMRERTESVSV